MKKVNILDYGMGNIASLKNAIEKVGYKAELYSENKKIESNILFIPGVGAFNSAMNIIRQKNYDELINSFLNRNDNVLFGICLGMQILLSIGHENRKTLGLNIIKGEVNLIQSKKRIKLPNVGMRKVKFTNSKKFTF